MLYNVVVVENATDKVVRTISGGPMSILRAERVNNGVNINIDHDRFHTEIVEAIEVEEPVEQ